MAQNSNQSDNRSVYVLVASTVGTVFSLAATWIVVAHEVAHAAAPLVA
jgi:hypothetical protein